MSDDEDKTNPGGGKAFSNLFGIDIHSIDLKINDEQAKRFGKRFSEAAAAVAKRQMQQERIRIDDVRLSSKIDSFHFGLDGPNRITWEWIMGDEEGRNRTAQHLMSKAIEVWLSPVIGWRFSTTYNPGDFSLWFTAEYHDDEDESGKPLVKMTIEFTEETLLEAGNLDEFSLYAERRLTELAEKCQAELAMFE